MSDTTVTLSNGETFTVGSVGVPVTYIVGVQFEQVDPEDRTWIGAWVLRQSRYIVQQMSR